VDRALDHRAACGHHPRRATADAHTRFVLNLRPVAVMKILLVDDDPTCWR